MKEPTLVILAAGMGSRFGGLKQITPVDDAGHTIIDFSLFDAYRAGFRKVVFIIKREIEKDFRETIGKRMEKYFDVKYVFQQLEIMPRGYEVPEDRIKPWGTGHAVMCCRGVVDGPFAVLNADDFYGPAAFTSLYNYLAQQIDDTEHAMVAYLLKNTVTEHGYVARGVCEGENGYLTDVVERTHIEKDGDNAKWLDDNGDYHKLDGDTLVSMNCWAFGNSILDELMMGFAPWLDENLPKSPLVCEYFLPTVVNNVINSGKGKVRLLNCDEVWYGMTYKEDMITVRNAIAQMKCDGVYPEILLD